MNIVSQLLKFGLLVNWRKAYEKFQQVFPKYKIEFLNHRNKLFILRYIF